MPSTGSAEQQEYAQQINEYTKKAMENIPKSVSPFTAATGDKAKEIIKEMIRGNILIYRTVGVNQAASTEGSAKLGESLMKALLQIGITEAYLH